MDNFRVSATHPRALTLEWNEPRCRDSAIVKTYNITVAPNWTSTLGQEEKSEVLIPPDCLTELPNVPGSTRRVSITIGEIMCNSLNVQLISCAPYELTVTPMYEVTSANEGVTGRREATRTEPLSEDLNVHLSVKERGSRWFLLSWNQPNCSLPVTRWTLDDNSLNKSISLPPYCVLQNDEELSFNVSSNVVCDNIPGMTIKPCTHHNFTLKLKLSSIADVFPAENGTATETALPEGKWSFQSKFPLLWYYRRDT